jgi:hypothetical protein
VPLQNRVTPFGEIVAVAARGLFMGNRGVLHDGRRSIVRSRNGSRWIICCTRFNGRRRAVMAPGHYTELFFFDEAVALAAGHRPCAQCRRDRLNLFRTAIRDAGGPRLSAVELDAQLDRERRDGNAQRRHRVPLTAVPAGAMVVIDDAACLVAAGEILQWSWDGYRALDRAVTGDVQMLTPPLTAMALRGGYRPTVAGFGWASGAG